MASSSTVAKLPIGIEDFPKLREGGYIYVDKTAYLHQLITEGVFYFLSRPRRFGKSLTISTLECIFKGKKHLFKETWIDKADYDWPVHPVIRIDMPRAERTSTEALNDSLIELLFNIARAYEINLTTSGNAATVLGRLIAGLAEKHARVVVLIDEYDKPILDNIEDIELAKQMRDVLRQFYTILKAQDGNLRFVMLTGVTKFSGVSVFSGLNNLDDLTMTGMVSTMLGYTQAELEQYFAPWIARLAENHQRTVGEELVQIQHWYNGYQFSEQPQSVYNPFSMMLLFKHQIYKPHWFRTGTPTFLVDLIEKRQFAMDEIEQLEVSALELESHDIEDIGLVALLYQTGYLTIKHYDQAFQSYFLGYPNYEVKSSLAAVMLARISGVAQPQQTRALHNMMRALREQDYEEMFNRLQGFLAALPYQLHQPTEKYYQTIFYLIFQLLGFRMQVETATNIGRIDALLELEDRVLIFEFKLDKSAEVALQQIHERRYYQPYQHQGKLIHLFGVNFSTEARNIVEWQRQVLECQLI